MRKSRVIVNTLKEGWYDFNITDIRGAILELGLFIKELVDELHIEGKRLDCTKMPKYGAKYAKWKAKKIGVPLESLVTNLMLYGELHEEARVIDKVTGNIIFTYEVTEEGSVHLETANSRQYFDNYYLGECFTDFVSEKLSELLSQSSANVLKKVTYSDIQF